LNFIKRAGVSIRIKKLIILQWWDCLA